MARRGNSSSAYRLYDEDTAALRRPEKRNHPTIKQKKEAPAQDRAAAVAQRAAGRWSLRLIGNVLLICVFAFAVLIRYSTIVERDHQLETLKKEYTSITDENKRLQVEIDSALNLDKVEQVARNDLGMAKPEKYQTVYVNIKGDDYVEVAKDASGDEEKGGKQFYATIIQTLGNVLEYLY